MTLLPVSWYEIQQFPPLRLNDDKDVDSIHGDVHHASDSDKIHKKAIEIHHIRERLPIHSSISQSLVNSASGSIILLNYLRDFQSPPPVLQAALALEPKRQQLGRGRPSL